MNSIEERRLFYIFEYLEGEIQREALEALQSRATPNTQEEMRQIHNCINQTHQTYSCFQSHLGHAPFSPPPLSPTLRDICGKMVKLGEEVAQAGWLPWQYRTSFLELSQLLFIANLLETPETFRSNDPSGLYSSRLNAYRELQEDFTIQNLSPTSPSFTPQEINAILTPAPQGSIDLLRGIIEFYDSVLAEELEVNNQRTLRSSGRESFIRRYTLTPPNRSLATIACSDTFSLHEVGVPGLEYKIPVFVHASNESQWNNLRDFLRDILGLLRGVLSPQDFRRFLHPPNRPNFSIVFNSNRSDEENDCAPATTREAAHYNYNNHRMVIRELDFIEVSTYTLFFHELGHALDNIFLSSEDRENLTTLNSYLIHLLRSGPPIRRTIPQQWPDLLPSISTPGIEDPFFPHTLDDYKETFADFIAEYLVDLFLGNNEESNPHQRARHRIVNRFFSLGGIYPRAFSVPNIEAAYHQEGIAIALREHYPQHFELGLSFEGLYASSLQRGVRFGAYGLFHRRERLTFSAGLTLGVDSTRNTPRLPILAQIGLSTSPHRTFRGEIYLGGGVNAIGRPIAGIAEIGVRTYLQPSGELGRVSFYTGFFAQSTIPEFHPVLGVNLGLIFFPNMDQN